MTPDTVQTAISNEDGSDQNENAMDSLWTKMIILTFVVVPFLAFAFSIYLAGIGWITPLYLFLVGGFYAATVAGVSIGFHRMLTHQGFKTSNWFRAFLLIVASMSLQGSARSWAATHRKHHARSDKSGDPHSPLEGFWYGPTNWWRRTRAFCSAHLVWLLKDRTVRPGTKYDKPDRDDQVVDWVSKTFILWAVLSFVLPGLLALAFHGKFWLGVFWGGLVRVFLVHHITWSVNSVCHLWGSRPFESGDNSRNNFFIAWLGWGEGWHNNHHAFPKSARHGLRWWEIDPSWIAILILKWLGLIRDVILPTKEEMERSRRNPRSSFPSVLSASPP